LVLREVLRSPISYIILYCPGEQCTRAVYAVPALLWDYTPIESWKVIRTPASDGGGDRRVAGSHRIWAAVRLL